MYNWKLYKELYPEIANVLKSPTEFMNYYNKIGKVRGHIGNINQLYPDFFWQTYQEKYPDLALLNRIDTELHWIQKGRLEGRTYNNSPLLTIDKRVFKKYKCAVIVYHHDKIYTNETWIKKCANSIFAQTFCEFDIHELNYSNSDKSYFQNYIPKIKGQYFFHKYSLKNQIESLTFLLEKCFNELSYDIVFNTDVYDYYEFERFIYQLNEIDNGSDICSSLSFIIETNYEGHDKLVSENNTMIFDREFYYITKKEQLQPTTPIKIPYEKVHSQIEKNSNIINFSGLCFTKKCWNHISNNINIRFRADFPFHDLSYYKRIINANLKISIVNRNQVFIRKCYKPIINYYSMPLPLSLRNMNIEPNISKYIIFIFYYFNDIKSLESLLKLEPKLNEITLYFFIISEKVDELISYNSNNIKILNYKNFTIKEILELYGFSINLFCDFIVFIKNYNENTYNNILSLTDDNNNLKIHRVSNLISNFLNPNQLENDEISNNIELVIESFPTEISNN